MLLRILDNVHLTPNLVVNLTETTLLHCLIVFAPASCYRTDMSYFENPKAYLLVAFFYFQELQNGILHGTSVI